MPRCVVIVVLLLSALSTGQTQELQSVHLGECRLVSGEAIQDCRIGYRTVGTLDERKSNAILFPSWFSGRSEDLLQYIGPGKLVDSAKYFVIAVDAFGDGVSSSPSNSAQQPRLRFPRFTIRDMVNAQHRLLTEKLGITRLHAVIGLSMGGMQAFEWAVAYPDFMDKVIPVVGTPRLTSYDLILWQAYLDAIEANPAWQHGEYTSPLPMRTLAELVALTLTSPEEVVHTTGREQVGDLLSRYETRMATFDVNDRYRQLQAMMAHDISRAFGGAMEHAAAAVRAKLLVIVARQDHTVNPQPAEEFARLSGARLLDLSGDCGHLATRCERDKLVAAVASFLSE